MTLPPSRKSGSVADVVISDEGCRVLVALRDAMATSGALAPHLLTISNEAGLPMRQVRERLRGLEHTGLVDRQGESLEFSLTKAGEAAIA